MEPLQGRRFDFALRCNDEAPETAALIAAVDPELRGRLVQILDEIEPGNASAIAEIMYHDKVLSLVQVYFSGYTREVLTVLARHASPAKPMNSISIATHLGMSAGGHKKIGSTLARIDKNRGFRATGWRLCSRDIRPEDAVPIGLKSLYWFGFQAQEL